MRYSEADELHPDLPSRAALQEDEMWDEINRRKKRDEAHRNKIFNPDTDWDHDYPLPPF